MPVPRDTAAPKAPNPAGKHTAQGAFRQTPAPKLMASRASFLYRHRVSSVCQGRLGARGAPGPGTVEPCSHTVPHTHPWRNGQLGCPEWDGAWSWPPGGRGCASTPAVCDGELGICGLAG